MTINNDRKMWSQPTITSVERMKNAANGTHNGLAKGPSATEYSYDGPGS